MFEQPNADTGDLSCYFRDYDSSSSSAAFEAAFQRVVGLEGGYVNDPRDPGGETKFGICKRSYPHLNIKTLTVDDAKRIFKEDYWNACRCDILPAPLDLYVFDGAVNHGVNTAIRILQRLAGVKDDGLFGMSTEMALKRELQKHGAERLGTAYLLMRARRYTKTANFDRFGEGWFNRLIWLAAGN